VTHRLDAAARVEFVNARTERLFGRWQGGCGNREHHGRSGGTTIGADATGLLAPLSESVLHEAFVTQLLGRLASGREVSAYRRVGLRRCFFLFGLLAGVAGHRAFFTHFFVGLALVLSLLAAVGKLLNARARNTSSNLSALVGVAGSDVSGLA